MTGDSFDWQALWRGSYTTSREYGLGTVNTSYKAQDNY